MRKNKKTTEKINVGQEIRRLGAGMEKINDNVMMVAERYGDIKKTLDSHTEILNSHTEMLSSHAVILNSHTDTLDSHTEMIGSLATNLAIVKEDVEFIKSSLKKKVDVEEFAALERRVAFLEKRR